MKIATYICPSCRKDFGIKYGMKGIDVEKCKSCGDAYTVLYVAGFNDGHRAGAALANDKVGEMRADKIAKGITNT